MDYYPGFKLPDDDIKKPPLTDIIVQRQACDFRNYMASGLRPQVLAMAQAMDTDDSCLD